MLTQSVFRGSASLEPLAQLHLSAAAAARTHTSNFLSRQYSAALCFAVLIFCWEAHQSFESVARTSLWKLFFPPLFSPWSRQQRTGNEFPRIPGQLIASTGSSRNFHLFLCRSHIDTLWWIDSCLSLADADIRPIRHHFHVSFTLHFSCVLGWPRLYYLLLYLIKKNTFIHTEQLLLLLMQQRPSDKPAGRSRVIYITRPDCALRSDDKTTTCSLFHNSVHLNRFPWQQHSVTTTLIQRQTGGRVLECQS